MATHPSILAWRIPWTEEPGGLQSMGSQRVRQLTDRQTYTHRVHGVTESWIANTHTHTHTHTSRESPGNQSIILKSTGEI